MNAGFMVGGQPLGEPKQGSAVQGKANQPDPIQHLLAFPFLDSWFEKKIRPSCQGEAYLTRFAGRFSWRTSNTGATAEAFHKNPTDRFGKFGSELREEQHAGDVLRTLCPGGLLAKTGEKPDTFDLGSSMSVAPIEAASSPWCGVP